MANDQTGEHGIPDSSPAPEGQEPRRLDLAGRALLFGAFLFFGLTLVLLLYPLSKRGQGSPTEFLYYLGITAVVSAICGFALIRVVRKDRKLPPPPTSTMVVPPQDKDFLAPAIQQASDPIKAYIELSGLIGATGVFRKLEISGMPLATISMTLILCVLTLVAGVLKKYVDDIPETVVSGFFDLAKLTLGAFIGSFVTKTSSREVEAAKVGAVAATAKAEADNRAAQEKAAQEAAAKT